MQMSSTFWLPAISNVWRQHEETYSKYADLATVAGDIVSIMLHAAGVQARFSLQRDVIGWSERKSTGETVRECFEVLNFA